MTFAYYLATNYTDEAFRAHQLDYGRGKHELATDVWGTREGVEAAILAHNEIIREIADRHKHVIFVDEAKQMPKSGAYFTDICHQTDAGIAKFAEHAMRAVKSDIERWKSAHAVTKVGL
jgi:hypothetical protein